MQAAQHRGGYDFSRLRGVVYDESSWNALSNALMWPRAIVVIGVLGHHAAQLVSMEDEHMVKAFAFQASDATLTNSVSFRRSKWRLQLLDTCAAGDGCELLAVLAVIVVNEVLGRFAPGSGFPELLGYPSIGRRGSHCCVHNPACLQLDNDEYVECPKQQVVNHGAATSKLPLKHLNSLRTKKTSRSQTRAIHCMGGHLRCSQPTKRSTKTPGVCLNYRQGYANGRRCT